MEKTTDAKKGVKILKEIGSGAFGKVSTCMYRGREHVVKKVLTPSSYHMKAVLTELQMLIKLKHPRILELVNFYITETDHTFVLEYMKRGSLRETLNKFNAKKWKFCETDLLSLFMDVVFGVKFLHKNGIIHRDLKPENILVDQDHRLKIADFGISKLTDGTTDFHTACGTLTYMAPEVYMHQPYDKSVDVWALGIILYEMAMCRYPFTQNDRARIMNQKLVFIPPVIDCVRRKYSPEVQEMLVMMVQRSPKKRSTLTAICSMPILKSICEALYREEYDYFLRK